MIELVSDKKEIWQKIYILFNFIGEIINVPFPKYLAKIVSTLFVKICAVEISLWLMCRAYITCDTIKQIILLTNDFSYSCITINVLQWHNGTKMASKIIGAEYQGCINCAILPSGMGARGVSSEHVENMEMFSCSPS